MLFSDCLLVFLASNNVFAFLGNTDTKDSSSNSEQDEEAGQDKLIAHHSPRRATVATAVDTI